MVPLLSVLAFPPTSFTSLTWATRSVLENTFLRPRPARRGVRTEMAARPVGRCVVFVASGAAHAVAR